MLSSHSFKPKGGGREQNGKSDTCLSNKHRNTLRNRVASGCCGSKKNTFLLYFAYSFCAPIKRSIFVAISAYINSDI